MHAESPGRTADRNLLDALRHAARATSAVIDEHFTLTAVVLEREIDGIPQTLLVELLDAGPDTGDQRWRVVAYDELRDLRTPTVTGPTVESVISSLAWSQLQPHRTPSDQGQNERSGRRGARAAPIRRADHRQV